MFDTVGNSNRKKARQYRKYLRAELREGRLKVKLNACEGGATSKCAAINKRDSRRKKQRSEPWAGKHRIGDRLKFAAKLKHKTFQLSFISTVKLRNSIQGIWNKNGFDNIRYCGSSQMGDGEAITVDGDTISRKGNSNGIIPRLDNCFTIAKYAIVDRLDRNADHSTCHFYPEPFDELTIVKKPPP
jgi:hypothetical protein